MTSPALERWEADLLRVTAFTSDAIPATRCEEWWKAVAGGVAESMTNKPALALYAAEGPIDDARLTLNIAPGRVDWILLPDVQQLISGNSLGQFAGRDRRFSDRLSEWLHHPQMTVQRVAYGAAVRLPVQNRTESYRILSSLLPNLKVDPDGSRDLLYQINRPRPSREIENLLINRLSKWASVRLEAGVNSVKISSSDFARVEIDVNTDQNSQGNLATENGVFRLVSEFMELAREIVANGDIP